MAHNFYRGLNVQQDSRFGSTDKKLLRKMRFDAALYKKKVDMKRVNVEVMKQWVKETITDLLGFEDDIVTGLVDAMLEADEAPDPKNMQLQLTGFLEKKAGQFVQELWTLLVDAQSSVGGIPSAFLEQKKEQMRRAEEMRVKAMAEFQASRPSESKDERGSGEGSTAREPPRRRRFDDDGSDDGDHRRARHGSRFDDDGGRRRDTYHRRDRSRYDDHRSDAGRGGRSRFDDRDGRERDRRPRLEDEAGKEDDRHRGGRRADDDDEREARGRRQARSRYDDDEVESDRYRSRSRFDDDDDFLERRHRRRRSPSDDEKDSSRHGRAEDSWKAAMDDFESTRSAIVAERRRRREEDEERGGEKRHK